MPSRRSLHCFRLRGLAGALLLALCASVEGVAHDANGDPNWIANGKYTGKDGVHCCGVNDCPELKPHEYTVTPAGVYIHKYNELVPHKEITPSEDRKTYRCHVMYDEHQRRCFFMDLGNS